MNIHHRHKYSQVGNRRPVASTPYPVTSPAAMAGRRLYMTTALTCDGSCRFMLSGIYPVAAAGLSTLGFTVNLHRTAANRPGIATLVHLYRARLSTTFHIYRSTPSTLVHAYRVGPSATFHLYRARPHSTSALTNQTRPHSSPTVHPYRARLSTPVHPFRARPCTPTSTEPDVSLQPTLVLSNEPGPPRP